MTHYESFRQATSVYLAYTKFTANPFLCPCSPRALPVLSAGDCHQLVLVLYAFSHFSISDSAIYRRRGLQCKGYQPDAWTTDIESARMFSDSDGLLTLASFQLWSNADVSARLYVLTIVCSTPIWIEKYAHWGLQYSLFSSKYFSRTSKDKNTTLVSDSITSSTMPALIAKSRAFKSLREFRWTLLSL